VVVDVQYFACDCYVATICNSHTVTVPGINICCKMYMILECVYVYI
jgi:hypothetical protein